MPWTVAGVDAFGVTSGNAWSNGSWQAILDDFPIGFGTQTIRLTGRLETFAWCPSVSAGVMEVLNIQAFWSAEVQTNPGEVMQVGVVLAP